LALQIEPDLVLEDAYDFIKGRQRYKQGLHETKAASARFVDQFDSGQIDLVGADLAVADGSIAGELETGNFE
jgi:hypothetical protein